MQHTIEDLTRRINVMHDKSIELHRIRNKYSKLVDETYDHKKCQILIDDIQYMARLIAGDTGGDKILTEMEYKDKPL
jgi:hypothetical protein|tara:strand:- start:370 stop:600 length:231 start_codon:yes stop_codon:yes gene_type:complete